MEHPQSNNPTTIMDLPDDCLGFVFKYLTGWPDRESFGLTCHRWLNIQNRNCQFLCFNWLLIHLSQTPCKTEPCVLDRLLKRFQHLKSLSLSGCRDLPDSCLEPLQHYGSNLQTLCLDCCLKIADNGLSFVASGCPSLTFITLYRCNITDLGLETLAKSCLALEDVNLSCCSSVTDQGILFVAQNCFKLRAIRVTQCQGITGVGFRGCSQTLAYLVAESCKLEPEGISSIVSGGGLEYLNISNIKWSVHVDGFASIGAGHGARLRVLNMTQCWTLGDESVLVIAKGCPSLVEWDLSLCHNITFAGWEYIALNCHNLEKLHVNGCLNLCDRGLQALSDGCQQLSVLYMNKCPQISSIAVESFRLLRGDVVINQEEGVGVNLRASVAI